MSLCFMLTAGLGTRLRPFTLTKPKPCLPFLNLPLMNYGFYLAAQGGFTDFIFNTHHLPQEVVEHIDLLRPFGKTFHISDETSQILGSGGALWKAASLLKNEDYFLVANGDEILIPQDPSVLKKLFEQAQSNGSLCTLLTCDHPELLKTLKPVWVDHNKNVKGFGMTPPSEAEAPVHYTGYKVFSRRIFDWLPKGESNIFYDVLAKAISQGERVSTFHLSQCDWHETGNFNSFLEASDSVVKENWAELQAIHTFFSQEIHKKMTPENDCLIHHSQDKIPDNLNFKGINTIGKNCSFDGQVSIKNAIIGPKTSIKSHTKIENTFYFGDI